VKILALFPGSSPAGEEPGNKAIDSLSGYILIHNCW